MNPTVVNVLVIIGAVAILRLLYKSLGIFSVIGIYLTAKVSESPINLVSGYDINGLRQRS